MAISTMITVMQQDGIINLLKSYKTLTIYNLKPDDYMMNLLSTYKEKFAEYLVENLTFSKKDNKIAIEYNDKYKGSLILSENVKYVKSDNKLRKDLRITMNNIITGNGEMLVVFHNK